MRKSLVYLDNVIQKALKDVLIPIFGYRDVSKTLGAYTQLTDGLRDDVTALQIPSKTKIFVHDNMVQPINILVPERAYGSDATMFEPITITINLSYRGMGDAILTVYIPMDGGSPYCASCNKIAYDNLKNVQVKDMSSSTLTPSRVVQVYFPRINETESSDFGRAVVTTYSEHRNVELTEAWNGVTGNEQHVTINKSTTVNLGTIPYFDPIPRPEDLVRSTTFTDIESVSEGAYKYLNEVQATQPSTVYMVREDELTNRSGILRFDSVETLRRDRDILISIFGDDWSELEIEFADNIKSIDGAFEGFGIKKTPKRIVGKSVISANRLFKGSSVTTIANQATLLADMPMLEYINAIFEGSQLAGTVTLDLVKKNTRLLEMNKAFKGTKITGTAKFWTFDVTYLPERNPDLSSLLPSPDPLHIRLEGNGCYEGVTGLPSDLNIPETWKTDNNQRSYGTVSEFLVKRANLLSEYDNDLSLLTLTIRQSGSDLYGLFRETDIKKTPKSIISEGAISINSMFAQCTKLIQVSPTVISQLTAATSAIGFLTGCSALSSLPTNIFEHNKNISNFSNALSGLSSMTGATPTSGGHKLWELAGKEGYPTEITGTACFQESTFDDIGDVPAEWGGNHA